MMPRLRAIVTAWVRSLAPNFERMFLTLLLTVSSLIESWAAICLLAFPSAIRRKTEISAGVREVDEAAFQPEAGEAYDAAVPVCQKIIVVSSAGPGWFADFV